MTESNVLELEMNLEDFEDFEPLPPAPYPGEIQTAEMRISDKGNEYYYVVYKVTPDDFPADYSVDNAPEGLQLLYARLQKPKSNDRRSITSVKHFYRAHGMKLKTSIIDPETWKGKRAKLVLNIAQYQGEDRNNIASIEKLD